MSRKSAYTNPFDSEPRREYASPARRADVSVQASVTLPVTALCLAIFGLPVLYPGSIFVLMVVQSPSIGPIVFGLGVALEITALVLGIGTFRHAYSKLAIGIALLPLLLIALFIAVLFAISAAGGHMPC